MNKVNVEKFLEDTEKSIFSGSLFLDSNVPYDVFLDWSKKAKVDNILSLEKYFDCKIILGKQVHSTIINVITPENIEKFSYSSNKFYPHECDGFITKMKNVWLSAVTADCVPVVLYCPLSGYIGSIHSGWRGSLLGINEVMVQKFLDLGCDLSKTKVYIGPSIGQKNYEVQEDLYLQFIKKDIKNKKFFQFKKELIYFDNALYVSHIYKKYNCSVDISEIDVFNDNRFFSYRSYCKGISKINGRNMSFIYKK